MKRGLQKKLAETVGVSDAFISLVINGHRRVGARVAKKLADSTGSSPLVWLYGTVDEKKAAIENICTNEFKPKA